MFGFPLFADENVSPEAIALLRDLGEDVTSALEAGLGARQDIDLLRHATAEGRVVLTHDLDFGRLCLADGEPFVGIVILRPGSLRGGFLLEMVSAAAAHPEALQPPFVLVVERRKTWIRVRLRPNRR